MAIPFWLKSPHLGFVCVEKHTPSSFRCNGCHGFVFKPYRHVILWLHFRCWKGLFRWEMTICLCTSPFPDAPSIKRRPNLSRQAWLTRMWTWPRKTLTPKSMNFRALCLVRALAARRWGHSPPVAAGSEGAGQFAPPKGLAQASQPDKTLGAFLTEGRETLLPPLPDSVARFARVVTHGELKALLSEFETSSWTAPFLSSPNVRPTTTRYSRLSTLPWRGAQWRTSLICADCNAAEVPSLQRREYHWFAHNPNVSDWGGWSMVAASVWWLRSDLGLVWF